MNKAKWLLIILASLSGPAQAMEGLFDRSTEIAQYIEQLSNDPSQQQLIEVARTIYISGIADDRLAQAISARLLKDIRELKNRPADSQYGEWMVKALGSIGSDTAGDLIGRIYKSTDIDGIRYECKKQIKELMWARRKNEIMASRKNYNAGDDMRVSQLMNLLQSHDLTYEMAAADSMRWTKILDDRLMQEIAKQVQTFAERNGVSRSKLEYRLMALYSKLLGYSHNEKYIPVLGAVVDSDAPELLVRSQAKKAIKRIRKNEPDDDE